MIVPAGVKVHLALGYTDMRKGLDGLAMLVQQTLKQDPFSGHLFAFRGKKASMLKISWWDGNGLCLFTKRLDQGLDGPATLIQELLKKDSFCGHLFVLLAFLSVAQRTYSYPLSSRIL
ncbi:IS66 family insertion sequence element accessory protein TnpB [Mesorhizobium sp. NPDC059024]